MKRKLRYILIGGIAAVMSLLPTGLATASATSSATTTNCNSNPILSGLWQGVNAATGANYDCQGNISTGTPGTSQPRPAPVMQTGGYVALGDSIAAGLGLPPTAGTDPVCGVSYQAYPSLVATAVQRSYQNYACSGATAGDLFTEQHLSGTSRDIEPQLTRAFAAGTPSLVTITAGANDTYWQYFARKCYVATCGTATDQAVASTLLSTVRVKLSYALSSIATRSNGQPPRVVLTGYYKPFSLACATQQNRVTAAELSWLNRQTDALNQVIASTVSSYSSFARYAPVSFSGHELCGPSPWVQGLQDNAPFHPTAQGQRAIANAVLLLAR